MSDHMKTLRELRDEKRRIWRQGGLDANDADKQIAALDWALSLLERWVSVPLQKPEEAAE